MNAMTSRANQLLHDVLELPADERAAVAAELLASLDDSEPTDLHQIETAWADEIERRARRVLTGESEGKPWDEVRRNIEGNLGNR
jgi:putative addiction module component (TIGR02574 family)